MEAAPVIPWLSIPPEMWTVQLCTTGIHAAHFLSACTQKALIQLYISPSMQCELSSPPAASFSISPLLFPACHFHRRTSSPANKLTDFWIQACVQGLYPYIQREKTLVASEHSVCIPLFIYNAACVGVCLHVYVLWHMILFFGYIVEQGSFTPQCLQGEDLCASALFLWCFMVFFCMCVLLYFMLECLC